MAALHAIGDSVTRFRLTSGGAIAALVGFAVLVLVACGGSGSNAASSSVPSSLTYSTNPAVYTQGTAIASNTPSSGGGGVASYSVAPPLPAGLSLNTSTGVVTGTPTTATPTASYTVTAVNLGGSTTATLTLTVAGPPACVRTCGVPVKCGDPDGCGGSCPSGSGCSYAGCYTPYCGCTANDPACSGNAACIARRYQECLAACSQSTAACCATYRAQYPADTCMTWQP